MTGTGLGVKGTKGWNEENSGASGRGAVAKGDVRGDASPRGLPCREALALVFAPRPGGVPRDEAVACGLRLGVTTLSTSLGCDFRTARPDWTPSWTKEGTMMSSSGVGTGASASFPVPWVEGSPLFSVACLAWCLGLCFRLSHSHTVSIAQRHSRPTKQPTCLCAACEPVATCRQQRPYQRPRRQCQVHVGLTAVPTQGPRFGREDQTLGRATMAQQVDPLRSHSRRRWCWPLLHPWPQGRFLSHCLCHA